MQQSYTDYDEILQNTNIPNVEEWAKPKPFGCENELPSFSVGALPEPFKSYVSAIAEHTQTLPDMGIVTLLSVIACCVQGKYKVEVKQGYYEPLNIYTVISAPPSERKSAIQKEYLRPLYDYEQEVNFERNSQIKLEETELKVLKNSLNKAIKAEDTETAAKLTSDITEKERSKTRPLRLVTGDTTIEGLAELLHKYGGKMGVFSTEGGLFKNLAGLYTNGKSKLDVILQSFSGDRITIDRKTSESIVINNPLLTVNVFMQDDILQEIFTNSDFKGNGLLARILTCKPQSKVGKRAYNTRPVPEDLRREYDNAIKQLLKFDPIGRADPAGIVDLTLSPQAKEVSEQWFYDIEEKLPEEYRFMGDWAGKLHGYTLRIAGLLHVMEHYNKPLGVDENRIISVQTMHSALELAGQFLAHSMWAYKFTGADTEEENAKYVWGKISAKTKKDFTGGEISYTKSEITKMCRRFDKVEELTEPLAKLEQMGYLRAYTAPSDKRGQATVEMFEVNPLA